MKEPKIKPDFRPTLHRDGTVSFWNVFSQSWERCHVSKIHPDEKLAMPKEVRFRLEVFLEKHGADEISD